MRRRDFVRSGGLALGARALPFGPAARQPAADVERTLAAVRAL